MTHYVLHVLRRNQAPSGDVKGAVGDTLELRGSRLSVVGTWVALTEVAWA